jgi:hypothetical protein
LPNGGSLKGLLGGRGSLDQNPLRGLSPDPFVGLYKLSALDPRIFMPLWYPLVEIRFKEIVTCHIENFNIQHM